MACALYQGSLKVTPQRIDQSNKFDSSRTINRKSHDVLYLIDG